MQQVLSNFFSRKATIAVLFGALVASVGFASQLYATIPPPSVQSDAAVADIDSSIGTIEWADTGASLDADLSYANTEELGTGFFLLEEAPAVPTGMGYSISFKDQSKFAVVIQDSEDAGMSVVDLETLELVEGVVQPEGYMQTTEFSEDGNLLVVGGDTSIVLIDSSEADPSDWEIVYSTSTRNDRGLGGLSLRTTSLLAIGYEEVGSNGEAQVDVLDIGDINNPVYLDNSGVPFDFGIEHRLYDITFSPNGEYLVMGVESISNPNSVVIADTTSWITVANTFELPDTTASTALAFSPDGNQLVVGHTFAIEALTVVDTSFADAADWVIERRFTPGSTSDVRSLVFNSNATQLAIAYSSSPYFGVIDTSNADVEEWVEFDTSESVGELPGGKSGNAGKGIAFSSDDMYIGVAHNGGTGLSLITTEIPATTQYLVNSNFDMSVPEDATIVGIEISYDRTLDSVSARAKDNEVRLTVDGAVVGDNNANQDTWWTGILSQPDTMTYGSEADMWGLEITPQMINEKTLGTAISLNMILGTVGVDRVFMTVYYTVPEVENNGNSTGSRNPGSRRSASSVSGSVTPKTVSATASVSPSSVCSPRIKNYIRLGAANNTDDVQKLEQFLNEKQGENVPVDGVYSQEDAEAVKRFQKKYSSEILGVWGASEPTGYVYKTTLLKINSFYCASTIVCPAFKEFNSETENPVSSEVSRTKTLLAELGFFTGEINENFDAALTESLKRFQEEFAETMLTPWNLSAGTGYKYKTTNKFLNLLVGCKTSSVDLDGRGVFDY